MERRYFYPPLEAIDQITLDMVRDLKQEIIALLGFTEKQREILLRLDPEVDLVGLARYREGLNLWDHFTRQEQALMKGHPWDLNDLQNVDRLMKNWGSGELEAVRRESP